MEVLEMERLLCMTYRVPVEIEYVPHAMDADGPRLYTSREFAELAHPNC